MAPHACMTTKIYLSPPQVEPGVQSLGRVSASRVQALSCSSSSKTLLLGTGVALCQAYEVVGH